MKRMLALTLFLCLFTAGCITTTSKDILCPDGSLVDDQCPAFVSPSLPDPDEHTSILLDEDGTYFVKTGGTVSLNVLIYPDETLRIIAPDYHIIDLDLDNVDTVQTDYPGFSLRMQEENKYLGTFKSPPIPGDYNVNIFKRKGSSPEITVATYDLTVVGPVYDEELAFSVANRFMLLTVPDEFHSLFDMYRTRTNWAIISQNITSHEDYWDVSLVASYDKCGTDLKADDCITDNTVTGHFLIDKNAGQIIG